MASVPRFERTMHGPGSPQRRTTPLPDAVDHQSGTPCPQGSRSLVADLPPAVRPRRADVEVAESVGLEDLLEVVSVRGVELLLRAGTEHLTLAGDDDKVQRGANGVWSLGGQNDRRVRLDARSVSERLLGSRAGRAGSEVSRERDGDAEDVRVAKGQHRRAEATGRHAHDAPGPRVRD